MTKKIFLALAALVALTLSFSSCKKDNKGGGNTPTDVKLAVNPNTLTVMIGKTATLDIKTHPAKVKYTCVSKDPAIATVDNKGVITGVAEGNTTVTVTAGSVTKEIAVKVIPLIELKDDVYLGLYNNGFEKYIPAIYIPYKEADLTKAKQVEIVYAMEEKGWEFSHYKDDPKSEVTFLFNAPEAQQNNWRLLSLAYYHSPNKGPKYCLGMMGAWKLDPLAPADQLSDDIKPVNKMIMEVMKLYGFTENPASGKVGDGSNAYSAYNLSRGADNPLELMVYSKKVEDPKVGTAYIIRFQISWRGPEKKTSSLATRTAIRPVLEDNVDLSMLLRKNK